MLRCAPHPRRKLLARSAERGYALLLVLFFAATAILAFAAATPSFLAQGRREREDELIWRGEQYERGVRLYFRKLGRFPTEMEDLTKANNGIHFLRKPYKDPMNSDDGAWRLIYVLPSGQLVGSLRFNTLQQLAMAQLPGGMPPNIAAALGAIAGTAQPAQPGQPGATPQSPPATTGGSPSGGSQASPGPPNAQPPATPEASANPSAQAPGEESGVAPLTGPGTGSLPMSSACQAFPVGGKPNAIGASAAAATSSLGGDQGTVFGGAIIGVASKVNRPSLKIFNCADHYNGWEFIWNPAAQQMTGGPQPGAQPPANPAINNPRLQFMSPNPNPQPQPPQPQPNPQP